MDLAFDVFGSAWFAHMRLLIAKKPQDGGR